MRLRNREQIKDDLFSAPCKGVFQSGIISPTLSMLEFIQNLKQRYQVVSSQFDNHHPQFIEYQQRIEQLIYAEAFIRKGELLSQQTGFPLQIAVIGPTQAGKSSIVNTLLANEMAGVSPLAGYTVHPQGFCHRCSIADCQGLQYYFGRFQQLAAEQLSPQRYDCYSLGENTAGSEYLPAGVLWDTPDFDSIDAADYREGVIRTIALADIIILTVSKEKYADQSVWDMMATIEAFNQPTVICLNKLTADSEALIIPSLKEKWLQSRQDALPALVPLYFDKQQTRPVWPEDRQQVIREAAGQVERNKHPHHVHQLLSRFWDEWLEPVNAELEAAEKWRKMVDDSIEQALKEYQRDYLNHPHYYDTFQDALVELLNLLEIPGLSRVIGSTRRLVTWPIRKLMTLGKKNSLEGVPHELALLEQLATHVLVQLSEKILQQTDTDALNRTWWQDAAAVLRNQKNKLQGRFIAAAGRYHEDFQQDVEATAQKLYLELQQHPVLLNTLRTTRATTDATALAAAIYTGGIGVHDLIVTPAVLSLTSMLAESAAGSYMSRQEAELKRHQLNTVRERLFEDQLKHALYVIPQQLPVDRHFNISRQQLKQAEKQLNERKNGLRIL